MGISSSKSGSSSSSKSSIPQVNPQFRAIADNFTNIEQVQSALRRNGLESSNLIVSLDYTKSNEWTGKHSFGGLNLHHLGPTPNPYEQAITIIGRTLEAFDDDNLIPVYGFGDAKTQDRAVFTFLPQDQPLHRMGAVLTRYRELTPQVKLAGPTSFAPAIYQAMRVVAASGFQYHILLIIADGQVTRPVDMKRGQLSNQEKETMDAIVAASELPLSIVMVGVGDGPWEVMQEFDDLLPRRKFDNFQFCNFTDILMRRWPDYSHMEAKFSLAALMEIPEQYKLIQKLGLLGSQPQSEMRRLLSRIRPPIDPPAPPALSAAQMSGRFDPASLPSFPPAAPTPFAPSSSSMYPPLTSTSSGYPPMGSPPPMMGGMPGYGAPPPDAMKAPPTAPGGENLPAVFFCPITQEVMRDPVLAADGYSYERSAIEQWLRTHDTSPMSNQRLPNKMLTTNHALRSSIRDIVPNLK